MRFALPFAIVVACSPSSPRDIVPVTRDVRGEAEAIDAGAGDVYEHVVKRPHGTIAIAESRGMARADAIAIADELADRFERCAAALQEQGLLVEGAARIVAEQDASWSAPATSVRLAPGGAVAQNALLCLVAPLRSMQLKPSKPNVRAGVAIESTWQPARLPDVSIPPN
ncbi:MAG: hypothetical protein KIT84_25725 [Labilithrix sp.]|nr:hypothetical protein [Labilithrix sp.]MCW5814453.1 hypothetical protein [Labilithrix sp.]